MIIIVKPNARSPGKFDAFLDDEKLCSSRTPMFSSARILLGRGVDPKEPIAMRHAGDEYDSLTSTVGYAALWTISDSGAIKRVLLGDGDFMPSRRVDPGLNMAAE